MLALKTLRFFLQGLFKQLAVAAIYLILAQLVLRFFSANHVVTMVYPPSGFALAMLLLGSKRYVWAIWLAAFSSNALLVPVGAAVFMGLGNALSALCGACLLNAENSVGLRLTRLYDYLRLLAFGAVISCSVAAFVGSTTLLFFEIIPADKYATNLRQWWMGDALGVVLVTPLLLVLRQSGYPRFNWVSFAETLLLLGLSFVTGHIVFLNGFHNSIGQVARGYWMFLFITWVAVRLGTRGTVIVVAMAATQALIGSASHIGFFADDMVKTNLANYWFYMVILALVGIALAMYVSERVQTEQELQQYRLHLERLVEQRTAQLVKAKEAAEAANIAKSTFIATMSHELRTPLNAVLGFSELMSQDASLTVRQKETLGIINRSGAHLLSMINDVLDISKIEAGRLELDVQVFDLLRLLHEIGDMMSLRATNKQLRFTLDIASDLTPFIQADSGKLRQILINLLGNAIKFTQHGGVVLSVQMQTLSADNLMLIITVSDTGMGIPADKQTELFQPFMQLMPENADVSGTGLGLAISKSLIELMKGEIRVSSTPGVGSTFYLQLPVTRADSFEIKVHENEQAVRRIAPYQPTWRLLVVDDNADNRLLLVRLLTEVGFQVQEAENGLEAVCAFEQWQPHLIWMDMRMPVMDGYVATAKIRQLPHGQVVKILALTASAFKEQHASIMKVGCDAVLHKPFHAPDIFAALTYHLGVKFIYRSKSEPSSGVVGDLTADTLRELPFSLRQQLHAAALNLDTEEVEVIIREIVSFAPDVAAGLQRLLETYQFEQIINLAQD